MRNIDGMAHVAPIRFLPTSIKGYGGAVTLIARDMREHSRTLTIERAARLPAVANSTAVWINVALADRLSLQPDAIFTLQLNGREYLGSIRGVHRDFGNSTGAIVMDYQDYRRLTDDTRANAAALWLQNGSDGDAILKAVREQVGAAADISRPEQIRARSLRIFDGVFAITYLLLIVAVVIGLFGISVNASAQVLARRAEFGMLRHIGFTQRQIGAMLGMEGFGLGALGVFAGLCVGVVVSAALIHVIARQSFYWTMDLHVPGMMLASLLIVVPLSAMVVAWWSGRAAMNDDVVRAVKEDW
jgi:putative ABC transport system permease protein